MNSLRRVSCGIPRKRWQPRDEVADCVLCSAGILVHMSKQVLLGSDSPAGQVEGKPRVGRGSKAAGSGKRAGGFP